MTDPKRLLADILAALHAAGPGAAELYETAADEYARESNNPRFRLVGEDGARRFGGRPVIDDVAALEAIAKAVAAGTPRSTALAQAALLERHRLLTRTERLSLRRKNFEPESIVEILGRGALGGDDEPR